MPIGDIFPESCGEPKNQWEYDGGGLPTMEPFPSFIVKLTLAPWSKESTCGIVIHSTMGSLQLEYKSLLTHLTMAYVVNPRIDSMENLSTGQFLLANERLGLVHQALPQCSLPKSRSYGLWPTISTNFIYMGVSENGETCHFLIAKTQGYPSFRPIHHPVS